MHKENKMSLISFKTLQKKRNIFPCSGLKKNLCTKMCQKSCNYVAFPIKVLSCLNEAFRNKLHLQYVRLTKSFQGPIS